MIGTFLRAFRKSNNLTQQALAAELGWERSTLATNEKGHSKPSLDLVIAVADHCNATVDAVLGRPGSVEGLPADESRLLTAYRDLGVTNKALVLDLVSGMAVAQADEQGSGPPDSKRVGTPRTHKKSPNPVNGKKFTGRKPD
jgi:transcriptional regulator with XRE-family HTH domain